MSNIAVVKTVVHRILVEDLESSLDLIAEDVVLRVGIAGRLPFCFEDRGRQAVVDYFTALGGIVTFWQVGFFDEGTQVLVLGNESFTLDCGIQAKSDFALVFGVRDGLIAELLIVEDLSAFLRDGADRLELQSQLAGAAPKSVHPTAPARISLPGRKQFQSA
jgi:ketosteroid isomerase-like protein